MVEGGIELREALRYCALPTSVPVENLATGIREAYQAVDLYLGDLDLDDRGPSIIRYRRVSEAGPLHLEVGWVMPDFADASPPFVVNDLPAGTYAVRCHNGPYSRIGAVTRELIEWGDAHDVPWDVQWEEESSRWGCWYELYLSEPSFGPEGPTGCVEVCLRVHGADLRDV